MLSLKNEIVSLDPFARVNVVEPGWTVTHMARPALDQPGVIARAVASHAAAPAGARGGRGARRGPCSPRPSPAGT
jgi:hypothetical protein